MTVGSEAVKQCPGSGRSLASPRGVANDPG
jgi:hypothetical protein